MLVLFHSSAGNEDVVEVDEHKGQVRKDGVHHPQERQTGVLEPEWHADKLEKAERRYQHRFRYLQIALVEVQLAEYPAPVQPSSEVRHVGERVLVGGGYQVEQPKVTTRPLGAAVTGRPTVSMLCCMPWLGCLSVDISPASSGNSCSHADHGLTRAAAAGGVAVSTLQVMP
jgi:hypothetical protein